MSGRNWKTVGILVLVLHIALCAASAWHIASADLSTYEISYVSNLGSDFVVLLACACIYFSSMFDRNIDRGARLFMLMLTLEAFLLAFDIYNWIVNGNPDLISQNLVVNYLIYSMMFAIPLAFWFYLREWFGTGNRGFRTRTVIVIVLSIVGLALVVSNFFTDIYFYVSDDGWYHRADTFIISMICPTLINVVNFETIIRFEKDRKRRLILLGYVVIPFVASILQSFFYGISLQYIALMVALIIMYANIYVRRGEDLATKESEMVENRMEVMVSQIQPHFLYNVLTSIMNIKGCSMETQQAIVDFSRYLRFNLDSTKSLNPIPVSREIEHIETYIEIRKLTYGDRLDFTYRIGDPHIHVPPQSLKMIVQTILEINLGDAEHLEVKVETEQGENDHIITIYHNNPRSLEESEAILGSEQMKPALARLEHKLRCRFTYELIPGTSMTMFLTIPKTKGGRS